MSYLPAFHLINYSYYKLYELNTTNLHFRCASDSSLDIQPSKSKKNEKCTTTIHFHNFICIKRTVIAHIYHNYNNTNGTKHGLNYYKCFSRLILLLQFVAAAAAASGCYLLAVVATFIIVIFVLRFVGSHLWFSVASMLYQQSHSHVTHC